MNAMPVVSAPGTTTADANQLPTPAGLNSTDNPPEQAEFMQVTFDMVIGTWPPLGQDGWPCNTYTVVIVQVSSNSDKDPIWLPNSAVHRYLLPPVL